MVTMTEVRNHWESVKADLAKLTPWERKVRLAMATFTPPPRVVKARPPVVRRKSR